MRPLLALDLPLGAQLEAAIRRCVDRGDAFCVLDQRLSLRRREEQLALLGATSILDQTDHHSRREGQLVDDGVGLVILTSGSSGEPKAAELTWDALRASAVMTQETLRGESSPVWFPCLPANHVGGLAVLLRAILGDASLVWAPGESIEQAPRFGATHVALVRTQLARFDVRDYHRVLLGGGRPPHELPPNVVTTWGMTETGSGVVYDGVPLKGVDVASINGELCVRSPTLFRSYRNAVKTLIQGPDGRDDWFATGDAGEVINGLVSVRGRLGYVINTGAEKLWPEDLEAVLASVEGVVDVAVTGVDDPEWGQRVVALIVSDGTRPDDAIRARASEYLGPWASPKEIRYVTAIPRTANGKVHRVDLANVH